MVARNINLEAGGAVKKGATLSTSIGKLGATNVKLIEVKDKTLTTESLIQRPLKLMQKERNIEKQWKNLIMNSNRIIPSHPDLD